MDLGLLEEREYVHAYSDDLAPVQVELNGKKYSFPVAMCGMYNVVFALPEQRLKVNCPKCKKRMKEVKDGL